MSAHPRGARVIPGLGLALALLLAGCGGDPGPTETSAQPTAETSSPTPRGRQAPGSPLRIPLPADTLSGRLLADAEAQLADLIADACGGDQCISVRTEPRGSLDPNGRSGCETYVVSVPGSVGETTDQGSLPVLYVPRGGTITLVVELRCTETSGGTPTDTAPSATPDGNGSAEPETNPSPTSTATGP